MVANTAPLYAQAFVFEDGARKLLVVSMQNTTATVQLEETAAAVRWVDETVGDQFSCVPTSAQPCIGQLAGPLQSFNLGPYGTAVVLLQ